MEDRFPRIWIPSPENRDLRGLSLEEKTVQRTRTSAVREALRLVKACVLWIRVTCQAVRCPAPRPSAAPRSRPGRVLEASRPPPDSSLPLFLQETYLTTTLPTNRAQKGVSEFDAFASHSAGESGFVKRNAASLCKAKRSQTHDLRDSSLPSLTGPPLR
jgi:hypothetical protein